MSTGVIIFAHGSRIPAANDAVRAVTAEFARAGKCPQVETAFLELGEPDLDGAVAALAARGVKRILVIPYFLTLGIHLERDLPGIVARLSGIHPNVEIRVTPPLDGHPALVQILLDRSRAALADSD
ncbi:MAG TPA: CbiX/SirB N-terminal domain-containing protein [Bryobacteraceae bacterium]|nr:CbiX/SirB N-terminal domain-containing protein [Bryobacteraceae bacterium]